MNQEKLKEVYAEFSKYSSSSVRTLALGGIGLIWTFKLPETASSVLPNGLYFPGMLLALTLAIDHIHYLVGTVSYGYLYRYRNKRSIPEGDISDFLSVLIWILFGSKHITLISAYIGLITHLYAMLIA